jgi:hypothetical protein
MISSTPLVPKLHLGTHLSAQFHCLGGLVFTRTVSESAQES